MHYFHYQYTSFCPDAPQHHKYKMTLKDWQGDQTELCQGVVEQMLHCLYIHFHVFCEMKTKLNWIELKVCPFFSKIAWKSYPKRSLGGLCRFLKKSTLSCRYLLSDDSTFGQRGKKTQQQQLKCPKLVKLLKINPIKIWKFSVWRPYDHVFLTNWWLYSLISYFFSCSQALDKLNWGIQDSFLPKQHHNKLFFSCE